MAKVLKILSVFLTCTVFFGKVGIPAGIALFGHDYLTLFIVCGAGGITGNIVFTYLSAIIIKRIHRYRVRKHLIHKRRIFTKFNRTAIKIKQRFGLAGIAFITPMFLSTPLGAFLAERFFRDKKKIVIYLSISVIFWELVVYLLLTLFYDQVKDWFV